MKITEHATRNCSIGVGKKNVFTKESRVLSSTIQYRFSNVEN